MSGVIETIQNVRHCYPSINLLPSAKYASLCPSSVLFTALTLLINFLFPHHPSLLSSNSATFSPSSGLLSSLTPLVFLFPCCPHPSSSTASTFISAPHRPSSSVVLLLHLRDLPTLVSLLRIHDNFGLHPQISRISQPELHSPIYRLYHRKFIYALRLYCTL